MSMSEERLERLVAEMLEDAAPANPPSSLVSESERAVDATRRWPGWLAMLRERPMRRGPMVAVGSPTTRRAAILVATLLLIAGLALASVAGSSLLANADVIVVDQGGDGDVVTIAEAVAMAQDGDRILVRPGTYVEAVMIEKDITLSGDGPVESIVVTAPEDGPEWETRYSQLPVQPYAIVVAGSDAVVSGLTLHGEPSRLFVDGGDATITGMRFDEAGGEPIAGANLWTAPIESGAALIVTGGSHATVQDNGFRVGGGIDIFDRSSPTIESNRFEDGPGIYGVFGDGTIIRENVFSGPGPVGIRFGEGAEMLIEGNTITGRRNGIGSSYKPMGAATIVGNTIIGAATTAILAAQSSGQISNNELIDNNVAISWEGREGRVEGNTIRGGNEGMVIKTGSPIVRDNTIEGTSGRAFATAALATPVMSGNTSCGNGVNLSVISADESLEGIIRRDNEICEDATSE